jgi:predicted nucleic acid-binding protein
MLLLISDANILIDIEIGGLAAPMFSLEYQFAVPDVLYYEELEEQHSYMLEMGLAVKDLDEVLVARVFQMAAQYPKPGRNDLFALVLAHNEKCPLLTGDKDLKAAAVSENVEVRGTLWLVNELVSTGKISVHVARGALQRMRVHGRRLPWELAESGLREIEQEQKNENEK